MKTIDYPSQIHVRFFVELEYRVSGFKIQSESLRHQRIVVFPPHCDGIQLQADNEKIGNHCVYRLHDLVGVANRANCGTAPRYHEPGCGKTATAVQQSLALSVSDRCRCEPQRHCAAAAQSVHGPESDSESHINESMRCGRPCCESVPEETPNATSIPESNMLRTGLCCGNPYIPRSTRISSQFPQHNISHLQIFQKLHQALVAFPYAWI